MDSQILWNEIDLDPLGRAYAAMTDVEIAADLNIAYREKNLQGLSGDVIFQQSDNVEFGALTNEQRQLWMAFCGRVIVDPWAEANVNFVVWIYKAGSQTVTNLAASRIELVSQATELGLGVVKPGHVQDARLLGE